MALQGRRRYPVDDPVVGYQPATDGLQPFGYMPPQANLAFAQAAEHQARWGMPGAGAQLVDIAAKTPVGVGRLLTAPISAVHGLYQKVAAADEAARNPSASSDVYTDPMVRDPDVPATALGLMGAGMSFAKPGAVGVFGGKLAKTADLAKLKTAEEMAAAEKTPISILKDTGWFKGADGQWRFEILDTGAQSLQNSMGEINLVKTRPTKLEDALQHDDLYRAYPELRDVPVQIIDEQIAPGYGHGSKLPLADPRRSGGMVGNQINSRLQMEPTLSIGDMAYVDKGGNKPTSVLLHEAQHLIQQKEGFDPGHSGVLGRNKEYLNNAGEVEARNVQTRQEMNKMFANKAELEKKYNQPLPKLREAPFAPWLTEDVPRDQQMLNALFKLPRK